MAYDRRKRYSRELLLRCHRIDQFGGKRVARAQEISSRSGLDLGLKLIDAAQKQGER